MNNKKRYRKNNSPKSRAVEKAIASQSIDAITIAGGIIATGIAVAIIIAAVKSEKSEFNFPFGGSAKFY